MTDTPALAETEAPAEAPAPPVDPMEAVHARIDAGKDVAWLQAVASAAAGALQAGLSSLTPQEEAANRRLRDALLGA